MENLSMPNSELIERVVIGSLLLNGQSYLKHSFNVKPEYFYNSIYRKIFETMTVTRSARLIREKFPDTEDAIKLIIDSYVPLGDISDDIKLLHEKYQRRCIVTAATKAIQEATTSEEFTASEIIDTQISDLSNHGFQDGKPEHIKTLLPAIISKLQSKEFSTAEICTGISDIDTVLGGFSPKEVSIIAARPSMGKTSFMLHIIRHCSFNKEYPTLLFSLEMGKEQIASRIFFAESGINYGNAETMSKSNTVNVSNAIDKINNSEIYIDDNPGQTMATIIAKSEYYVKMYGIKAIFVDHIGYIRVPSKGRSRHEELSEISKQFSYLAKKLHIPIILICQLSREVEKRKPCIPMLSDLRESGSLEEDARKVILIYREDYYNRETDRKNIVDIIVAKNHNGQTGIINILGQKENMTFSSIDRNINGGWGDNSQNDR